ncbi:hypothetical protein SELMODRAFT_269142 [Selaginella moellendorffii]|uniref:Neutral ceramidase n=1 Tax=Selaginella moellendorffii TaxID=88036 RepID=D8ST79_SELML|nr:hypothetical protein SELMODRAFT_269142 [Selaginella moellendorffii]
MGAPVFAAAISIALLAASASGDFLVGLGSYDVTGPAADVNMMGYADPSQNAAGIHLRLRARSFIVAESGADGRRVAFVNVDSCMGSQAITIKVLSKLKDRRYGDTYSEKNVIISGIHTHSGPGGYLQYVLYIVTSIGFVKQSFNALVDGIFSSIVQAHENLRPGSILLNEGELLDANINRSPSAYLNNPVEERKRYKYNVDKNMVLLKFLDSKRAPIGSFSWFPVHCTSMNRTNELISGDNKGAAAHFMEAWFDKQLEQEDPTIEMLGKPGWTMNASVTIRNRRRLVGDSSSPFIAAFSQSNEGDVSPNTLGAFCADSTVACEFNHSTCDGRNEQCIGRGPGYPDHFASTKIIAQKQLQKAIELFRSAKEQVVGRVNYKQTFVDFTRLKVTLTAANGTTSTVTTCPAAVGFSFAAGTTDGPGAFDFTQGDTKGNAFWRIVRAALKTPNKAQVDCQYPKPILIDTGEMTFPYDWAPSVLPIQISQIGQLIILSVPAEFSTMAGRRLRDAVKETLVAKGRGQFGPKTRVVIAGLSNDYSQYVTTFEEYQIQRYEGASTLFGPHTLSGYLQEFRKLAIALAENSNVDSGPSPPDLLGKQLELLPPVVMDTTPVGVDFGDAKNNVKRGASYRPGDVVEVVFWTGCPRNDLLTEKSFSSVEIEQSDGSWRSLYDDNDWSVRFLWRRPSSLSSRSYATIRWEIPQEVKAGTYRISHFGASKSLFGSVRPFSGSSNSFQVKL